MSMGTAGYYVPPVEMSYATPEASYAGGQSYLGESGNWGGAGAYCADAYSSYMAAQYGALGDSIAAQQLNAFRSPLSSWYPDDIWLKYAQYGFAGVAAGAALGAGYLAAAAAGPAIYAYGSDLLGTSAAVSPELAAAGAGTAQYGIQNASELESLGSEVSSFAAEGGTTFLETEVTLQPGDLLNRVWDSRWFPGSTFSGPFGGSYSPGGWLPISSDVAALDRGLNIPGILNNAQMGGMYQITDPIPAIFRTSIGGTTPELVIAPDYRSYIQLIESSISNIPSH